MPTNVFKIQAVHILIATGVALTALISYVMYAAGGSGNPQALLGRVVDHKAQTSAGVSVSADAAPAYHKSSADYRIPEMKLIGMDGETATLADLFDNDKLIILDFVFTTCPSICPVLSATLAGVQKKLSGTADQFELVSISIDPEQDTPARLKDYARRFRAGPHWRFFTGQYSDIIALQRVFDAYRGNKMSHRQLIFLRAPGDASWVRLEGAMRASDVFNEYRMLQRNEPS